MFAIESRLCVCFFRWRKGGRRGKGNILSGWGLGFCFGEGGRGMKENIRKSVLYQGSRG